MKHLKHFHYVFLGKFFDFRSGKVCIFPRRYIFSLNIVNIGFVNCLFGNSVFKTYKQFTKFFLEHIYLFCSSLC